MKLETKVLSLKNLVNKIQVFKKFVSAEAITVGRHRYMSDDKFMLERERSQKLHAIPVLTTDFV